MSFKPQLIEISNAKFEGRAEAHQIAVGENIQPDQVIRLVHDHGFRHVVQRDGISFESEIQFAQNMITQPEYFLARPADAIFGTNASLNRLEITCSADQTKHQVLLQFESFLENLKGAKPLRDDALMVADELYTNGAKNYVSQMASGFSSSPPDLGSVRFIADADDQRLLFGCVDSFGALDYRRIIQKIQGCFTRGVAESINMGPGGAGIGSFMVFNASISYYIGVKKGQKSIVLCALPLGRRRKDKLEISKNIHILTGS